MARQEIEAALQATELRLQRWSEGRFLASMIGAVLLLVFFFLSPRWPILLGGPVDSHEWSRGLGFLQQCENPWRSDVEPALRARLLPPLLAHAVGLGGYAPFALSWLGALILLGQVARWMERTSGSRVFAALTTLCLATTSAVLVPLHWLGMNDAWVWLGLAGVVFSPSRWALPAACLLCPWIDERFVLGLPLALALAARGGPLPALLRRGLWAAVWLLPFLAGRVALHLATDDGTSSGFLATAWEKVPMSLAWAPLGWWMGLRAGWLLCALAVVGARRDGRLWMELATVGFAVGASTFLAHDFSRSIAIVIPLLLLGAVEWHRRNRSVALILLLAIGVANLVLPATHVVERRVVPILPLPVELLAPLH